jgi:hypothetical protein
MNLRRTITTAAVALLVAGGAQVAGASQDGPQAGGRPVVLVAGPALAADRAAQAAVAAAGAQLRAPRSPTEQLSVTHLFAARGYAVVAAGLSRRTAIDPVARRYRGARFTLLPAAPGARRLRAALAAAAAP